MSFKEEQKTAQKNFMLRKAEENKNEIDKNNLQILKEYLKKESILWEDIYLEGVLRISCQTMISKNELVKIFEITEGKLGVHILNNYIVVHRLNSKINKEY